MQHGFGYIFSSSRILPTPPRQIGDLGRPAAPDDAEHELLVAVVDLLVLHPGRDETEVTRLELGPLAPALGRDGAPAGGAEDDRVLVAVVVDRRGGVRLGDHARRADAVAQVRDGVAALHAFRLASRGLER